MPNAENALLRYEAGQNASSMTQLTDSGDQTKFTSTASLWSGRSGSQPEVRPNGLVTGGAITVGSTDDTVDVAALTCYLAGVLTNVSASSGESITRGLTTDTHMINSVTVTSGGAIAVVVGTDHTAFSTVRGDPGGPPLIPVGSIEIGQVRTTSITTAAILASEIFQVIGLHQERSDFPVWNESNSTGSITFAAALPQIHTGPAAKQVWASYAEPIFADISRAVDFVPPENSNSLSSTQIYGSTLGATSTTLNQGTFTFFPNDGVSDAIIKLEGENLWFKFFPDRLKTLNVLAQGKLGFTRAFPAGDNITASCTISAQERGLDNET